MNNFVPEMHDIGKLISNEKYNPPMMGDQKFKSHGSNAFENVAWIV
jgi:hypothetical protein